ncbi:hypothetical protein [Shouchella clausii]|uniref:hypothetical protein n=1 Tax=Shouchella clausii TaxID=79880 RepID=UPI001C736C32|nr:hypothetical protein [Shouchella clausii]MBX0320215.1 hypothetical protein [Shouchella clausii]
MGLLVDLALDSGIVVPSAYMNIYNLTAFKENVRVEFFFYQSQNAHVDGKKEIKTLSFSFRPNLNDDALNFYKQAYYEIKRLPEYREAVDVLEHGQVAFLDEDLPPLSPSPPELSTPSRSARVDLTLIELLAKTHAESI